MAAATTMVIESDATETGEATDAEIVKSKSSGRLTHKVLEPKYVTQNFIRGATSDVEGFKQLLFHGGCAAACGLWISYSRESGAIGQLVLAELLMGLVCSFYFAGFHEMIHGTAFHTRGLNKLFSHIVGFSIFRGANWYWYFHWHHHRFTNDPARDPELSGTTVDRSDPTKCQGFTSRLGAFLLFLSGYPFGFERILGMAAYAIGQPPRESWVDTEKKVKQVQQEYIVFIIGYVALAVLAVHDPATIGASLWYYWLLPHMLGAGHLRYYQTAEHRACQMGKYTDTNAWVVSRTTATWWIYSQLAWNMPYHQEHHAWPNVPFYLLPALHTKVEADGIRPESGCSPTGVNGYFWMHWKLFHSVVVGGGGDSKDASKSKPQKSS